MTTKPPIAATGRTWLKLAAHLLLLLAGVGGGVGLIWATRKPEPPPSPLIYTCLLVTAPKPLTDFQAPAQWARIGANVPTAGPRDWKLFGNMQLATFPRVPASLMTSAPDDGTPFASLRNVRIDVVGEEREEAIRTSLMAKLGGRLTEHHFEMREGQVRVIELSDAGTKAGPHHYVIVSVQRATAPAGAPMVLPNFTPRPAAPWRATPGSTEAPAAVGID